MGEQGTICFLLGEFRNKQCLKKPTYRIGRGRGIVLAWQNAVVFGPSGKLVGHSLLRISTAPVKRSSSYCFLAAFSNQPPV